MSDPNLKGIKRSPSNPATRRASTTSSAKSRALSEKSARPKPMLKRSPAEKAPARKATKSNAAPASKPKKSAKPAKPAAKAAAPAKKSAGKVVASGKKAAVKQKSLAKPKAPARKPAPSKKPASKAVSKSKVATQPKSKQPVASPAPRVAAKPTAPQHVPRQPTRDEAAALKVFEKAHREFARGRFAEAGSMFRSLLEKHPGASEVAARARTYLTITESRLRREISLPRDADSLYDRGVIELNRGEYVAAQEMFERALKREPEAAHIHYGLAATRARLGSIDSALQSLQKALDLQPSLRVRAQHDHDLATLRNDPVFEQLIFAPRL